MGITLLNFAEAQKRGIQDHLESLDEFELLTKSHTDSIHEKLIKLEEDYAWKDVYKLMINSLIIFIKSQIAMLFPKKNSIGSTNLL